MEEQQNTSSTYQGMPNYQYTFSDANASSGLYHLPDYHARTTNLEQVLTLADKQEPEGKNINIYLGDIDDKTKDRIEMFEKYGIQKDDELQLNYLYNNVLTEQMDQDAFKAIQSVQKFGSLENYFQVIQEAMPHVNIDDEKAKFEEYYATYTDSVAPKLQQITETQAQEMQYAALENKFKRMALSTAMSHYNAKATMELINQYNATHDRKVNLFINRGNHTNDQDVRFYYEFAKDKERVIDTDNTQGAIELGEGKDKVRFAAASNIYSFIPVPEVETFGRDGVQQLYSHMNNTATVVPGLNNQIMEQIPEEAYEKSYDWNRIVGKDVENFEDLDYLCVHKELGQVQGTNVVGQGELPDDIGLARIAQQHLKKQDKYGGKGLVLSGHFHSPYETYKEDLDIYSIRSPTMYVTKKDGQVNVSQLELSPDHAARAYDDAELNVLYNQYYEMYMNNYQQAAAQAMREEQMAKEAHMGQEADQYDMAA